MICALRAIREVGRAEGVQDGPPRPSEAILEAGKGRLAGLAGLD